MNNPWDSVSTPPDTQLKARLVSAAHPLRLYWAKDHDSNYLFIYALPEDFRAEKRMLPAFTGMEAAFMPSRSSDQAIHLVLTLKDRENWGIFSQICNDLILITAGLEDTPYAAQVVLHQLARWHDFLKARKADLLSEELVKGLIGELYFLDTYLIKAFGAYEAISSWKGPLGAPQDFRLSKSSVEIKCRADPNSPYVRISSVDQLCPEGPDVYLAIVNLMKVTEEDDSIITLPKLVASVRARLGQTSSDYAALEAFEDLLFRAGYLYSETYDEYRYVFISEVIYLVETNFPRLCREGTPLGVTDVAYSIDLSACQSFRSTPAWMKAQP